MVILPKAFRKNKVEITVTYSHSVIENVLNNYFGQTFAHIYKFSNCLLQTKFKILPIMPQ